MAGLKLVPIEYGDQHALQRQALFLYDLLLDRDPIANISHKSNPTFYKHLEFINSRPYAIWNVIEVDGVRVGSIYLTRQDEIGLFLKKEHQGKGLGKEAVKLFMEQNPRPRYLANIAPKNYRSRGFFSQLGFEPIQYTFALESSCAGT